MKKFLMVGVVILSGLIFSGCGTADTGKLKTEEPQTSEVKQSPVVNDVIEPIISEENNLDIYKNEKYGFSLIFPKTWEKYTTRDEVSIKTIYFGFAEQEGGLFAVGVMTKSEWDRLKKLDGPMPFYLGENDEYVFGWTPAQHTANDNMLERMKEVNSIIETFKIIK